MNLKKVKNVKLVVFDLDGTLTPSKSPLEPGMSAALGALLAEKKVAVIGGGTYRQFRKQFVGRLRCPRALLANLFLFPTTSTSFYRYRDGRWVNVYHRALTRKDKDDIRGAFKDAFKEVGYIPPKKVYGKVIEDRDSQLTFSALGQDVVTAFGKKGVRMKEQWFEKNQPLRLKMVRIMSGRLPRFEVRSGGLTSIDVTQKGIDKAYGVRQIEKTLHIPIREMVFVGDALYRGGNDAAAKKTGVRTVATTGPEETEKIIAKILEENE